METAPAVLTEDQGPRVGRDSITPVFLLENHDEALPLWRATAGKQRILIHVDAHHDMWWVKPCAPLSIANFVCRALQEDLVREVYWVVPDRTWESAGNRRHVIRHLRKIVRAYPGNRPRPQFEKNRISATVLGKPVRACSIASLPPLDEGVLLDVDVDFLLLPRVTYGDNDPHASLPWCWPEELLARLSGCGLRTDLVTIAYSVQGGYTPLQWKYLGDELALRLQQAGPGEPRLQGMVRMREAAVAAERGELAAAEEKYRQARELLSASAAPAWHLAHLYLAMRRADDGQRMYQQAAALDPSYRTAYNSAGLWHFWSRRFSGARQEHWRTLQLDAQDPFAHLGLAWLAVREKNWSEAETLLRKALQLDQHLLDAYRSLGDVLVRQGRPEKAIAAYERSLTLALGGHRPLDGPIATLEEQERLPDPGHWRTYLELARLYERKGATPEAISRYRMSAAGGCDGVMLRSRLARLYLKQKDLPRTAGEAWQAVKLLFVGQRSVGRLLFRGLRRLIRHTYEAWLAR